MYPWHKSAFLRILEYREKFPQALFIHGPKGIGKVDFANHLIQSLLCSSPKDDQEPCHECQSCHWFERGEHPDLAILSVNDSPESSEEGTIDSTKSKDKKSNFITIDAIRQLDSFFSVGAQRQGYKVVFIEEADALNINAANALLKILEEPPQKLLFILVANDVRKILPTILSRCQRLPLFAPKAEETFSYLSLPKAQADLLSHVYGTPLSVERAIEDDVEKFRKPYLELLVKPQVGLSELSELALKIPIDYWLDWTHKWCMDLISSAFLGKAWFHQDISFKFSSQAKELRFDILAWERQIQHAKKFILHPLVPKLYIESLLIPWLAINQQLIQPS